MEYKIRWLWRWWLSRQHPQQFYLKQKKNGQFSRWIEEKQKKKKINRKKIQLVNWSFPSIFPNFIPFWISFLETSVSLSIVVFWNFFIFFRSTHTKSVSNNTGKKRISRNRGKNKWSTIFFRRSIDFIGFSKVSLKIKTPLNHSLIAALNQSAFFCPVISFWLFFFCLNFSFVSHFKSIFLLENCCERKERFCERKIKNCVVSVRVVSEVLMRLMRLDSCKLWKLLRKEKSI